MITIVTNDSSFIISLFNRRQYDFSYGIVNHKNITVYCVLLAILNETAKLFSAAIVI